MSFSNWIHKQIVEHPENEVLFGTKKKWAFKPWKDMKETQMNITKWIKAIWKATYFMIPTIYDIVEETKLWMQQKDQWLPGISGEGMMNRQNTDF